MLIKLIFWEALVKKVRREAEMMRKMMAKKYLYLSHLGILQSRKNIYHVVLKQKD